LIERYKSSVELRISPVFLHVKSFTEEIRRINATVKAPLTPLTVKTGLTPLLRHP
jgi:hypothetical protein